MDEPLSNDEQRRAARRFYSRFFLWLDVVLVALLALLWVLNHWWGS